MVKANGEYWGEKYKPFVQAWTNDDELAALADAIVRGASICHAIVPDLRKLIDEVLQHSDAVLAETTDGGSPRIENPTELVIRGGVVQVCECAGLETSIQVGIASEFACRTQFARASFLANAVFKSAAFSSNANFTGAKFLGSVDFSWAKFAASASFRSAEFRRSAKFWQVSFRQDVDFRESTFYRLADFRTTRCNGGANFFAARFVSDADFSWVSFSGTVIFQWTRFMGDAIFKEASFTSGIVFDSITVERRLWLLDAQFASTSRLTFFRAYFRPGCEVTLPYRRAIQQEVRDWLTTDANPWFSGVESRTKLHVRRVWIDFVQYLFVSIVAPILEVEWHWLRKVLGLNARGMLIMGEDSRDPKKLLIAASDYNRLRDNFRHQSSTDELEDLCHFRYMDLRRKAGDFWLQSSRFFAVRWCANGFYWLIWRNCVGYLVQPMRPFWTGFIVILIGWFIYTLGASNDTILYNGGLEPGQTTMDMWNKHALTPLYFSVTTFTTLGYGDFAPTGWLRAVAGTQAMIGVGLIALFTVAWGRKMIR